jgi:DNA-binding NtrC family response regulator
MIVARMDDIALGDLPAPMGRVEVDTAPSRGKEMPQERSRIDWGEHAKRVDEFLASEDERWALPPRCDEYGRPLGKDEFRSPGEKHEYEIAMEQEKYGTLRDVEREHIRLVLDATGGNKSRTAEILGINPTTLWRKLKGE